jgi:hypothetical protein
LGELREDVVFHILRNRIAAQIAAPNKANPTIIYKALAVLACIDSSKIPTTTAIIGNAIKMLLRFRLVILVYIL